MAGCYMLVEKNRHCIAFMLWEGCVREVVSMNVCLCVGPGMKGDGRACTDRLMGRPVASGDQKPWFTTERWSETHSSVWEDRHRWNAHARACRNTPTQIRTQPQEERLWCSVYVCSWHFRGGEGMRKRERNSQRKISFVKLNVALKTQQKWFQWGKRGPHTCKINSEHRHKKATPLCHA